MHRALWLALLLALTLPACRKSADAPEKAQAFGQRSKEALSSLVFGKPVRLVIYERDRYGRSVADIYVERGGAEVLANLEMIRQGLAWHYVTYDKREEFAAAEKEARTARRGLWTDANPTAPWEWRREARRGWRAALLSPHSRPPVGHTLARSVSVKRPIVGTSSAVIVKTIDMLGAV